MKGLDTSVLLALLRGDRSAREVLSRLGGVELATTEINLLELHSVAAKGKPGGRVARREVVNRLHQKMTVLPIGNRAVEQASRQLYARNAMNLPHVIAALGALEANGCDELFTYDRNLVNSGKWRFKITVLKHRATK